MFHLILTQNFKKSHLNGKFSSWTDTNWFTISVSSPTQRRGFTLHWTLHVTIRLAAVIPLYNGLFTPFRKVSEIAATMKQFVAWQVTVAPRVSTSKRCFLVESVPCDKLLHCWARGRDHLPRFDFVSNEMRQEVNYSHRPPVAGGRPPEPPVSDQESDLPSPDLRSVHVLRSNPQIWGSAPRVTSALRERVEHIYHAPVLSHHQTLRIL